MQHAVQSVVRNAALGKFFRERDGRFPTSLPHLESFPESAAVPRPGFLDRRTARFLNNLCGPRLRTLTENSGTNSHLGGFVIDIVVEGFGTRPSVGDAQLLGTDKGTTSSWLRSSQNSIRLDLDRGVQARSISSQS